MLSTYSNSGTIPGLATPELTQDLALPNLFYPEINTAGNLLMDSPVWNPLDINLSNLQALLEQASGGSGSISPQMTKLDSPRLEDLILPDFSAPSPTFSTSSVVTTTAPKKIARKRKEIVLESEGEEVEPVEERVTFAKDKFNGTRNTKIKPIG